eukprot:jgi/Mesen1/288/ME1155895C09514
MGIRLYKAYTPGTRNRSISQFAEISAARPEKKLTSKPHRPKGRNHRGVITSRHRGGGHKRLYRRIDFRRDKLATGGTVLSIEYDPNRNARICLIEYDDQERRYLVHPRGVQIGDRVMAGPEAAILAGNALPLSAVARAAGAVAQLIAKEGRTATLRLPSGEVRLVPQTCVATVGQVGHVDASNRSLGKAGAKRWLGKRPKVRGVVMNAADHPHGGGEGRAPIGRKRPLTPWGRPTLGQRSRPLHKYSDALILRRRKRA